MLWEGNLTRSDWKGSSFGAPLPPLLGHTSAVDSVTVTPDGSKIISGSSMTTAFVSGIHQQGRSCRSLKATPNPVVNSVTCHTRRIEDHLRI